MLPFKQLEISFELNLDIIYLIINRLLNIFDDYSLVLEIN